MIVLRLALLPMLSRLRPILVLALLSVAQLLALPLAWSGSIWNESGLEPAGTESCCCCGDLPGIPACTGCAPAGERDFPDGQEQAESNCPCATAPSLPWPEGPSEPMGLEPKGPESPKSLCGDSELSKVWPSIATRGARAPDPPPEVARKTQPVFTQAFRL